MADTEETTPLAAADSPVLDVAVDEVKEGATNKRAASEPEESAPKRRAAGGEAIVVVLEVDSQGAVWRYDVPAADWHSKGLEGLFELCKRRDTEAAQARVRAAREAFCFAWDEYLADGVLAGTCVRFMDIPNGAKLIDERH
jgi:hypothetical protein